MKKLLLSVLILAGCQHGDPVTLKPIKKDTTVYVIGKIHDTIYIHDTVKIKVKVQSPQNVVTHGDNSPAIISDKPVNIKY